jgi:hypothetical protein
LIIRCDSSTILRGRGVLGRREPLEQLAGDQQHLVGGLAAPALAAHAVGQDGQQATFGARVREDLHLILLIQSITAVNACGRQ